MKKQSYEDYHKQYSYPENWISLRSSPKTKETKKKKKRDKIQLKEVYINRWISYDSSSPRSIAERSDKIGDGKNLKSERKVNEWERK